MTSIEWLMQTLEQNNIIDLDWVESDKYYTIIEQAKEMHKQEIIDAANKLLYHGPGPGNTAAEQYYQETFVSKGSDDHISDISKMVELPQQEISDEEIEKAANEHFEGDLMWSERIAFKLAIRWYREQLKQL